MKTINGEVCERRPVWFMRQAGRYLPQYRQVREQAGNFFALCHDPALASEVTCQPVEILGVDAAIIFSDILVIPIALGLDVQMMEGRGPVFTKALHSKNDLSHYDASQELHWVYEAIELSVKRLPESVPLIGFAGSPWTLLSYMVEGQSSRDFARAKNFIWQKSQEAEEILDWLAECVIEHLTLQVKAGAQVVQIFDSWGGILSQDDFKQFSFKYIEKISNALESQGVPVIVFSLGGIGRWEILKQCSARCLGVDWMNDLPSVRAIVGPDKVLQGNLDPLTLHGDIAVMQKKLGDLLQAHGPENSHIINLGHGIKPEANLETVKAFVQSAKELSSEMMNPVSS